MRIIFILQNAAKGMAGGSRKKGGSVLAPCLPGGLAAVLLAHVLVPRPAAGALALREEFESSHIGMTAKGLAIWDCSHPAKSLGEGKAANPTREGFGMASLPQLVEGWELQCTALLPLTVSPQLKPPPLEQEN